MKKIIFLFFAIAALTGCSTARKVSKESTDTRIQESSQASTSQAQKDLTKTNTQENTHRTIHENGTSPIDIPGNQVSAQKSLEELKAGATLENECDGTKIEIKYDATTGTIKGTATTRPRTIPVNINRTIDETTTSDINQQNNLVTNTQNNQKTNSDRAVKTDSVAKESERANLPLYLTIAGGALLVLLFLFLWKRIPLAGFFSKFRSNT